MRRFVERTAVVGLLSLALACSTGNGTGTAGRVEPPVAADLTITEPGVREPIERLVAEARRQPDSARARGDLGMAYELADLLDAARQSYEQAGRLDPAEPRWPYYEAMVAARAGAVDDAIGLVRRSIDLHGDYAPAHLHLGNWLLDEGRSTEAHDAFVRATELAPDDPAGWAGLARALMRLDDPRAAVPILERVVGTHRDPYYRQLLGLAYRDVGDLERAREALAAAQPGRQPGWPDPWHDEKQAFQTGFGANLQRAQSLLGGGRVGDAIVLLEALLEERPGDRAVVNNLAIAYRGAGRADDAFRLLRDAADRDPEFFAHHLNLGREYRRRGEAENALRHLERAIELNPTLSQAHEDRAMILVGLGRKEEALDALRTALRHDGSRDLLYVYIGVVEGELGRWQASADTLEEALRRLPDNPAAMIALALARAELGEFDRAEALLDRAGELAPGNRHVVGTRAHVDRLRGGGA